MQNDDDELITALDKNFLLFKVKFMKILIKTFSFAALMFFISGFWCLNISAQTVKSCDSKSSESFVDEEYKVYSTILAKEKGVLIVRDKTNMDADSKNIKSLEQRGFEDFLSKIDSDTLKDFLTENNESILLEKKFSPNIDYQFITAEELEKKFAYKYDGAMNWKAFREQYPKAGNLYTLSRVGFNQDGSQALVFVTTWCRSLCGEGNYYILKKENGEWKIIGGTMTWIS